MNHLHTAVSGAFRKLAKAVDSPFTRLALELFEKGEWDSLLSLRVHPSSYDNALSYQGDAAVASFFRKCRDLPTSIDLRAKAVETFWKCEKICYQSNERLSPLLFGVGEEHVLEIVSIARKNVQEILGSPPTLVEGKFGPGATFNDRGKLTTVPDKMTEDTTFTPDALPWLFQWVGTAWASALAKSGRKPYSVRGNRFTTVPKDSSKDRGICIEPSINVFYQLGLGAFIKRRLKKAGIDLVDGQELHRRVARESSVNGLMATIDLSNASDTICKTLVKVLLPPKWFSLLDSLRATHTLIEGKWVKLEKFSSMGNGFTFELETLLFSSLARAVLLFKGYDARLGEDVLTYGDDIIVPTSFASDVVAVLKYFGFEPNMDKTFIEGPFRESCGGDYFQGKAVRPYFLKENPCAPEDLINVANGLRELATDYRDNVLGHHFSTSAWFCVLDALPTTIRNCRGPKDLGDTVIHDYPETWSTRTRNSIRYIRSYRPTRSERVGWEHWRPDVVLAASLYGIGDGRRNPLDLGGVTPRGSRPNRKVGWLAYS